MAAVRAAPPGETRPEGAVPARRLFGTDGVRGGVGELVTAELALGLGRAVAEVSPAERPSVLIVRDTRESGPMLESALAAGIAAAGGHALLGGVLPTPACALLVPLLGFDLGAIVSASHNLFRDNGIKFVGADGRKLSAEAEAQVEVALGGRAGGGASVSGGSYPDAGAVTPGRIEPLHGADADYVRALEARFEGLDLSGGRILLDCANGAAHRVGPEVFRRLGAEVDVVAASPDGRNINAGCGSTHVETLAEQTAAGGYSAGFAFDGDADRVLAADRRGEVVDGDELIALAALHLRAGARLAGNGVAVTVMTNFGFHRAMEAAGIEVAVTPVGDRHVLHELVERGWALGGEQSGHIIDRGFVASGDGVAAALLALEALGDADLAERGAMRKLPQALESVRVRDRDAAEGASGLWDAVEAENRALEGRGRVLVRPSGTEPVVRIMVEAPERNECEAVLRRLLETVERELG